MTEVFMPFNRRMELAILENADLFEGGSFPEPFITLLAHIAAYKEVLKRWENEDFSVSLSVLDYPRDAATYVSNTFEELKLRQGRLLGESR
jgi:hypothetical protein